MTQNIGANNNQIKLTTSNLFPFDVNYENIVFKGHQPPFSDELPPQPYPLVERFLYPSGSSSVGEGHFVIGVFDEIRDLFETPYTLDINASPSNPNATNSHPRTVISAGGYDPRIVPPEDITIEQARLAYGEYIKCNLTRGLQTFYPKQFIQTKGLVDSTFFVPRLKTGVGLYETEAGKRGLELGQPNFIKPDTVSSVRENHIFGKYTEDSGTEAAVSVAIYSQHNLNLLFVALRDDDGNGRIAILDAKTPELKFLSDIQFPAQSATSSDVDIIFDLKINSQSPLNPRLYVNMAGSSGKKAVRIYDLSDLTLPNTEVGPPPPPPPPPPDVSATPTPTPTITPTVTPTPGLVEYRYTRKSLVLENLVPCNKYELTLEFYSSQYGHSQIQILDFDDIGKIQYNNVIVFEAQNNQDYFRSEPGALVVYDDKSYQTIHYTIYHDIKLDIGILKFTLKNLTTNKTIVETRVIKCQDKEDCVLPRQECVEQNIQNIIQNPDGTFDLYIALNPAEGFATLEDLENFINANKCCQAQYKINDEEWTDVPNVSIISCDPLL